jgi:hypothetical protein
MAEMLSDIILLYSSATLTKHEDDEVHVGSRSGVCGAGGVNTIVVWSSLCWRC